MTMDNELQPSDTAEELKRPLALYNKQLVAKRSRGGAAKKQMVIN